MMRLMAEGKPKPRLTESLPGRMAAGLLAVLWLFSMSGVDSHSFSAYPVSIVLLVVLLLAGGGILVGYRVVRMNWLGWFTLAAAGYFLLRCVNSYAVVDSYEDEAIILGAAVYYVAGVYVAQNQRHTSLFLLLSLAIVLNMLAFWAVRQPWFCLEWTGRASETPEGPNRVPVSLFVYKNFAGFFFSGAGLVLAGWSIWVQKGWRKAVLLMVAVLSVLMSFFCSTRVPFFMLPVALVIMWLMDVLARLYSGRKLGWFSYAVGIVLLIMLGVGLYDLFASNVLGAFFSKADSHLRFRIWAAVCEVLPQSGLFGCGAGATEWEVIPYYREWYLPNYAHNDYLQVWLDYGLVGILLIFALLLLHVAQAFRCMASEQVGIVRRGAVAAALVYILLLAAYAVADFPWHSFALVCMGAFCCGILASPFACVRKRRLGILRRGAEEIVQVKAQRWPGRAMLLLVLLCCGAVCVHLEQKLRDAWMMQWEYNKVSAGGRDSRFEERRALIARLMPRYPAPALMDTYFSRPLYEENYAEQEQLLQMALAANPRQKFTAIMLADVLDARKKHEEAEQVFRNTYHGDAMPFNMLANWPSYYAHHLLRWSRSEMQQGRYGRAVSLLEYAMGINKKSHIRLDLLWREGGQEWLRNGATSSYVIAAIRNARTDLKLLKNIGAEPDDSWQKPMQAGGRPSLYRSWVGKK